jgi:hypothetical protein
MVFTRLRRDAALPRRRGQCRVWCGRDHIGRRQGVAGISTVLANNLLEGRLEDLPGEDLDVLLDVTRLGVGEAHDELEELLALILGLGYCDGVESLEVAADAVLLLDTEPVGCGHKLLEKIDGVDRSDIAFALLRPPDTRDTDAVGRSFIDRHGLEVGCQCGALLRSTEEHDAASVAPLLLRPVLGHGVELAVDLENSFCGVERD